MKVTVNSIVLLTDPEQAVVLASASYSANLTWTHFSTDTEKPALQERDRYRSRYDDLFDILGLCLSYRTVQATMSC